MDEGARHAGPKVLEMMGIGHESRGLVGHWRSGPGPGRWHWAAFVSVRLCPHPAMPWLPIGSHQQTAIRRILEVVSDNRWPEGEESALIDPGARPAVSRVVEHVAVGVSLPPSWWKGMNGWIMRPIVLW